ncbi:SgcJ/EcaC family oxidoreductase [Pelomonas sp. Root1444]|uniref:YybH family protein n=1 Tax=Pelomonas sp. Root1444 TaxID=1736464 RepID=UPI00070335A8|nr:SgcJ/EcaC family oxidoreductase [Pelomonas sp. Root1444]KQY88936.1 hypothetical protein ASD35_15550 [Pelomonas sp. Root1444]
MSPQEAQIHQLVADAQKYQFDVAELMKLHVDDAVIVNMAGRRLFGKQAFEAAMSQALASPLQHVSTATVVDRVRFLTHDCALVSCTKTVHDHRAVGDQSALPGRVGVMTYVVVRQGGGWAIASAQTTPLAT